MTAVVFRVHAVTSTSNHFFIALVLIITTIIFATILVHHCCHVTVYKISQGWSSLGVYVPDVIPIPCNLAYLDCPT